ncbi:MAG: glycosyltransferase family 2 protein [Elusimicrobiales bacterium]|nr:glycosyltransferase family 2 protein [Elusimicrobiales bacterium]
MPTISVAMIAHNEEKNLARSLASAAWADEVVFVDCGSTDGTALAARDFEIKYFSRPNSRAVYVNKQFSIEQASSDWVLILDADEEITPALHAEIRRAVAAPADAAAFTMPRRNFYFGRWLKHGGKYPDAQLRLFRRGTARYLPLPVHERLEVDGRVGALKEPLLHYPYSDESDIETKRGFYSEILARSYALKKRSRLFILFRPFTRFISAYFLKLGFLDGTEGLRTALLDFGNVLSSALLYIKSSGTDDSTLKS